MKYRLCALLVIFFVVLLSACSQEQDTNVDSWLSQGFVETEQGGFYLWENILQFCPTGQTHFAPFCDEPGCAHGGPGCKAWFDSCGNLGFDGDHLFVAEWTDDAWGLVQVDPTNGMRNRVMDFPMPDGSADLTEYACTVRFYGKTVIAQTVCLSDQAGLFGKQQIFVTDLNSNNITQPFQDYLSQSYASRPFQLQIEGNVEKGKLFTVASYEEPPKPGEFIPNIQRWLTAADLKTGSIEKIVDVGQDGTQITFAFVENGRLYTVEQNGDFMERDLKTGTCNWHTCAVEKAFSACYTDNYIVLNAMPLLYEETSGDLSAFDDNVYAFFDRNYRLLDQIELTDGTVLAFQWGDSFFFRAKDGSICGYMKSAEIGSGNLKLTQSGR